MIWIDMSMPTNCLDCPACNEYLTCAIPINGRKWKAKDVHEFGQGRPEWCPMKEQEEQIKLPTIPYDMKWNPGCEDCAPEGIDDCIECRKRMKER